MAYYQFDDDRAELPARVESFAHAGMNWLVRLAGLVVLAVGIWAAIGVINEAWAIYKSPKNSRVDAIALAVNEATHIDTVIAPPSRAAADGQESKPAKASEPFRLSYFIAWPIVLLLLLLIGRLAMAAIKTGGELALFDVQFRRFARDLVREVARARGS